MSPMADPPAGNTNQRRRRTGHTPPGERPHPHRKPQDRTWGRARAHRRQRPIRCRIHISPLGLSIKRTWGGRVRTDIGLGANGSKSARPLGARCGGCLSRRWRSDCCHYCRVKGGDPSSRPVCKCSTKVIRTSRLRDEVETKVGKGGHAHNVHRISHQPEAIGPRYGGLSRCRSAPIDRFPLTDIVGGMPPDAPAASRAPRREGWTPPTPRAPPALPPPDLTSRPLPPTR